MIGLILSISLKPSSKCGIFDSTTSWRLAPSSGLNTTLLVRKVNMKANNGRDMLLHVKEIQAPKSLTVAHIVCIQILLDLIIEGAKFHSGPVMALVHIFVDVFDGLDRCN